MLDAMTLPVAKGADNRPILASSLQVNALLTAAGGFLDGFTYFGHGHVFANAMTGNIVLLGNSLITADWAGAEHRIKPIIAFCFGIWFSQFTHFYARRKRDAFNPYLFVLVLEIVVLFACSFYPSSWSNTALIVAIAFTASAQVQTFHEVRGKGYFSTFTTGNLRTLCESLFHWIFESHDPATTSMVQAFAVICSVFLLGTICGGLAFHAFGNRALLLAVAMLAIALQRLLRGRAGVRTNHHWEIRQKK